MKKLLLILLCLPMIGFGQDKQEIYFEGEVEFEDLYDGINLISIQINKGELAGELVNLYFQVAFEDANMIPCKGNAELDGSGEAEGKKIKGKIIRSTGEFENYESGGTYTKKIYRPIELNWM